MMNTKQRLYHSFFHGAKALGFALLLLAGCEALDTPMEETSDELQLSDKEITFGVDGWKPMTNSRATIFETNQDIQNDKETGKGGGNFTLYAYLQKDNYTFIGGTRVWYFVPDNAQVGSWRCYDTTNKNFVQYYWPQEGLVDFFAYMPWVNSTRNKNITMGSYDSETGQLISCQMQKSTSLEDIEGQETLVAYTKGKSKADGTVGMQFVHPFSAVYFELEQAHRNLEIRWIRFNNVYLKGTTRLNATTNESTQILWDTTNSIPDKFKIDINQKIPDQINFGGMIGGPYLVMPQNLTKNNNDAADDVTVTIEYYWDNADKDNEDDEIEGDEDEDKKNDIYRITRTITSGVKEWIAGKKYTYVLHLGDNKEEILFKVKVEKWDAIAYDHIIDLE